MAGLDAVREAIEDAESLGGAASYSAWMSAAATIALSVDRQSFLPDSVLRSLLLRCLREADADALEVDWSERDGLETERQKLILDSTFRDTFENLVGYDPVVSISERPAYVGTVTAAERNAEEALEVWLERVGFRRNPVAYLKYRTRDGTKEYEQGSWAYRREVRSDEQLHVRLFDGTDAGSVDVYAHREPSITRGKEHFGRPNYRLGVCELKEDLAVWAADATDVAFERVDELPTGTEPRDYDCSDVSPLLGGGES